MPVFIGGSQGRDAAEGGSETDIGAGTDQVVQRIVNRGGDEGGDNTTLLRQRLVLAFQYDLSGIADPLEDLVGTDILQ